MVGFGCCLVFKWFNFFVSKTKKIMNIKFISVAVLFIILILILSEINNIKTKQQLQNDRYKAEERLKDSK
jgi:preprotein translocase subunit SecG